MNDEIDVGTEIEEQETEGFNTIMFLVIALLVLFGVSLSLT